MPLKEGKSNIGPNINELHKAGYKGKQAVAIALHKAYGNHPAPKTTHHPKGKMK